MGGSEDMTAIKRGKRNSAKSYQIQTSSAASTNHESATKIRLPTSKAGFSTVEVEVAIESFDLS